MLYSTEWGNQIGVIYYEEKQEIGSRVEKTG